MPNKSHEAYAWVMRVALPYLVGSNAVKCMRCIASDGEICLASAINETKSVGIFNNNLKHRLDFYHLFLQKWKNHCTGPKGSSAECCLVLETIHKWVTTWVYECETQKEYNLSYRFYTTYFQSKKSILGVNLANAVQKVVSGVLKNLDKCAYFKFIRTATLGFSGSSLVEVTNIAIKRGTHAAKPNQKIDRSGENQRRQVEMRQQNHNVQMAQSLRRNKLWTVSMTKDALTDYAEGVACANQDLWQNYCIVCADKNSYLVFDKELLKEGQQEANDKDWASPIPRFSRVRIVTIDSEKNMSCTCGQIHQYMWPCRHAMAVLKVHQGSNCVTPDLFHIRYWMVYNYYFFTEFGKTNINDTHQCMEKIIEHLSHNGFNNDAEYKGCNLQRNEFLKINPHISSPEDHDLLVANAIMRMGPVLKGNRDYLQKLNACDINGEDDEVVDNFDPTVDCGKTDNIEFIASPSRMIRNLPPPAVVGFPSEDIEDTRLYHAFYAAQNAAESDGDKEYLLQFLIKAETEFTAKSRKKQITSEETVIFNAYEGNKVLSAKRHKQMHERFTKK
jgi:hypothetical protein